MNRLRFYKYQVLCPRSGTVFYGHKTEPHTIPVGVCANGTLFAYCRIHNCRAFFGDHEFSRFVTENYPTLGDAEGTDVKTKT